MIASIILNINGLICRILIFESVKGLDSSLTIGITLD